MPPTLNACCHCDFTLCGMRLTASVPDAGRSALWHREAAVRPARKSSRRWRLCWHGASGECHSVFFPASTRPHAAARAHPACCRELEAEREVVERVQRNATAAKRSADESAREAAGRLAAALQTGDASKEAARSTAVTASLAAKRSLDAEKLSEELKRQMAELQAFPPRPLHTH